jgi:integrase
MIDAELKPLADKAVAQIGSADVVEWHRKFTSRAVADKAGRSLKAILRYANSHHGLRGPDGKVASEVLSTLRLMAKPVRKKTIVRDMNAWRAAVEHLPRKAVRDLLMTLALTGLRRSEWREACWQQVDLGRGVLRLPDPKSRIDTEIPLSSQVLDVLVRRHEGARGTSANPPDKAAVFSIDGVRPIGTKTLQGPSRRPGKRSRIGSCTTSGAGSRRWPTSSSAKRYRVAWSVTHQGRTTRMPDTSRPKSLH